jgi:hypothetical protein
MPLYLVSNPGIYQTTDGQPLVHEEPIQTQGLFLQLSSPGQYVHGAFSMFQRLQPVSCCITANLIIRAKPFFRFGQTFIQYLSFCFSYVIRNRSAARARLENVCSE